jgi:hypothetical protein
MRRRDELHRKATFQQLPHRGNMSKNFNSVMASLAGTMS